MNLRGRGCFQAVEDEIRAEGQKGAKMSELWKGNGNALERLAFNANRVWNLRDGDKGSRVEGRSALKEELGTPCPPWRHCLGV